MHFRSNFTVIYKLTSPYSSCSPYSFPFPLPVWLYDSNQQYSVPTKIYSGHFWPWERYSGVTHFFFCEMQTEVCLGFFGGKLGLHCKKKPMNLSKYTWRMKGKEGGESFPETRESSRTWILPRSTSLVVVRMLERVLTPFWTPEVERQYRQMRLRQDTGDTGGAWQRRRTDLLFWRNTLVLRLKVASALTYFQGKGRGDVARNDICKTKD